MGDFRVSTLNINGARDARKRASVFELENINVIFVQETHSDTLNETHWSKEWNGEVILSHLSRTSGGVSLIFSKSFLPKCHVVEEVMKGRQMVVRAKYEAFTMVFVNVYTPNTGPDSQVKTRQVSMPE